MVDLSTTPCGSRCAYPKFVFFFLSSKSKKNLCSCVCMLVRVLVKYRHISGKSTTALHHPFLRGSRCGFCRTTHAQLFMQSVCILSRARAELVHLARSPCTCFTPARDHRPLSIVHRRLGRCGEQRRKMRTPVSC